MDGSGGLGRALAISLSAGNLVQNTHTQEEKRKHFVSCMSEEADTRIDMP